MSAVKHTPGPWKIFTDSTGYLSIEPIDVYIDHGSPDITEEDRANARLIVAAPALRQTCEELLKKWWEEAGRCLSADCLVCKRNAQDKARFEAVLAQAEKKE